MQHLAIIPDGNRRWARSNKLKSVFGHKRGLDGFKLAVKFCLKKGIQYLSIYVFSLENFNRAEVEKSYLFDLFVSESPEVLKEFIKQGVKVTFVGNRDHFPKKVMPAISQMEEQTKHLDKLHLHFLFCYGAQSEIVSAAKELALQVKEGKLEIDQIDEKMFGNSLWTKGIPDPDLIIRTSKRPRLSNFLLYQAAYSEFKFLDCYWPEITEQHFESCFQEFKEVQRNFGK